ncbi:MAG TPA: SAM-dependent methyltransferase [Eubacteriaceae bacterium]|jgi:2-polyprenyl-3-methyl-5-hydroxy-6-metoxy-1,4-benzoquinol methylase|nr:SAM-dependent methyltransferase [Eubacteriaceae bacterium]
MELTQERVVPKLMNPKNGMLIEHIERYRFASEFARGRVLDIACGAGYGSELMLRGKNGMLIDEILGADIDKKAVEYALEHYSFDNVSYVVANALNPDLKEELGNFDTIVSFETIEHFKGDEVFIKNLYDMLKPGGTAIISTPFGKGKDQPCKNPYHVYQYKEEEFLEVLSIFDDVKMYHQRDSDIELPLEGKKYYLMVAVCKKC